MNPGQKQYVVLLFTAILLSFSEYALACQCPPTSLSMEETEKYEVIFRGTIQKVTPCGDRPGEALFRIEELYKGNAEARFAVQFDCDDECAVGFKEGEEWIIYSRYRQVNVARMDWCSRSRKFFRHEREDFYKVNYGNDYFEELRFLREKLGLHRVIEKKDQQDGHRNRLPDMRSAILLVLVSVAGILLFYYLFRRFFR
jgi:hypothetical protein